MRLVTNYLHQVVLGERSSQKEGIMSEEMANQEVEQKPEVNSEVNMEAYERTRNDMFKFKRQLEAVEKEKAEYLEKIKSFEDQKMEETENYKGLWEKTKQEAEDWKSKYLNTKESVVTGKKMERIYSEARKAGIREDMIDLLDAFDTSDVLVEATDSGKYVVNGADTWVNLIKQERPGMFGKNTDPKINNGAGNYDGREKTYSAAEILKLQKENPAKYQDIMTNKRHLIVK